MFTFVCLSFLLMLFSIITYLIKHEKASFKGGTYPKK